MTAVGSTDPVSPDVICAQVEARNDTAQHPTSVCYTLQDEVQEFTAPGRLGPSTIPLTVNRFTASAATSNLLLGSYQPGDADGFLAGERELNGFSQPCPNAPNSSDPVACLGALQPSPFTDVGVMAFESGTNNANVVNRLHVNSVRPPFSLSQIGAQPWVANWFNGEPASGCVNGTYLTCTIVTDVDRSIHGGHQRPVFKISALPVLVQVQNSLTSGGSKYRLAPLIEPDGAGILKAPAGSTPASALGVAPTETYYYAGYRQVSGPALWQAFFQVTDLNGGTAVTSSCASCGSIVTITIRIDPTHKDPKTGNVDAFAGTSCFVTTTKGSINCDQPTRPSVPEGTLVFTVNVKNF